MSWTEACARGREQQVNPGDFIWADLGEDRAWAGRAWQVLHDAVLVTSEADYQLALQHGHRPRTRAFPPREIRRRR